MKMLQDAKKPRLSSDGDNISAGNQLLAGHGMGENISNGISLGTIHQESQKDHPSAFSMKVSASSPAAG